MNYIFILFFIMSASALEISFIGPCDEVPLLVDHVPAEATVGDVTVSYLVEKQIPFVGSAQGIGSLFNTPMGLEAIEVISDTQMRAYGWCYFVDGVGPDILANEYPLDSSVQKLEWIFGYADYDSGEWTSYCRPAYRITPEFLCK
jgi:hypothetical protein